MIKIRFVGLCPTEWLRAHKFIPISDTEWIREGASAKISGRTLEVTRGN